MNSSWYAQSIDRTVFFLLLFPDTKVRGNTLIHFTPAAQLQLMSTLAWSRHSQQETLAIFFRLARSLSLSFSLNSFLCRQETHICHMVISGRCFFLPTDSLFLSLSLTLAYFVRFHTLGLIRWVEKYTHLITFTLNGKSWPVKMKLNINRLHKYTNVSIFYLSHARFSSTLIFNLIIDQLLPH